MRWPAAMTAAVRLRGFEEPPGGSAPVYPPRRQQEREWWNPAAAKVYFGSKMILQDGNSMLLNRATRSAKETSTVRRAAPNGLFRNADKEQSADHHKRAFRLFLAAAQQGDIGCQINVGNLYASGAGVQRDRQQALYWYKRAYRRGHPAAACNIADLLLLEGKLKRALYWLRRARDIAPKDGDIELELAKIYLRLSSVTLARTSQPREFITEAGHDEAVQLLAELEGGSRNW